MEVRFKDLDCLNRLENEKIIQLEQPVTIAQLLTQMGINLIRQRAVVFLVNGRQQRIDYKLQDGDQITVVPMFTGG